MLPASGTVVFDTENRPETKSTDRMLPRNGPDRIQIAFDDHRLVSRGGLIPPVTVAHHPAIGELVDPYVGSGDAPGRAGRDCIGDADALRAGGTGQVQGRDKNRQKDWHQAASTAYGALPTSTT